MSTTEVSSRIFEEIAELFASCPSDEKILEFQPSAQTTRRISQLLEAGRLGQIMRVLPKATLIWPSQTKLLLQMLEQR